MHDCSGANVDSDMLCLIASGEYPVECDAVAVVAEVVWHTVGTAPADCRLC